MALLNIKFLQNRTTSSREKGIEFQSDFWSDREMTKTLHCHISGTAGPILMKFAGWAALSQNLKKWKSFKNGYIFGKT